MTTLTCEKCEETWEFEAGLLPPEGWEHYCVRQPAPDVVAGDIEDWVPMVVRELKGRTGTDRWMRTQSVTLRGARLALDPDEYILFVQWVKTEQQADEGSPR